MVRGGSRDYWVRYPNAAEAALVVECRFETGRRPGDGRHLREGGVPIYWIVTWTDGQVEVDSDPSPAGYLSRQVLAPGHVLSVIIDGIEVGEIPVADILS